MVNSTEIIESVFINANWTKGTKTDLNLEQFCMHLKKNNKSTFILQVNSFRIKKKMDDTCVHRNPDAYLKFYTITGI